MTITRVEFLGFRLSGGPSRSGTLDAFKPKDHPKWTVREDGPWLYFEGEGMRLKVPAARCVVHYAVDVPKPANVQIRDCTIKDSGPAAQIAPAKKKPGRPPKPKAEEPDPDIDPSDDD